DIGPCNNHAAIEAAGAEQGRIENIGPVGCGDQDDAFVGFKTVHLDEQLIERLLALVVTAAETGATMTSDRVDFIYKDDARSVFLALFEKVADARSADADEHFDKVGSADREERHIGFAGDRPRKQ